MTTKLLLFDVLLKNIDKQIKFIIDKPNKNVFSDVFEIHNIQQNGTLKIGSTEILTEYSIILKENESIEPDVSDDDIAVYTKLNYFELLQILMDSNFNSFEVKSDKSKITFKLKQE